MQLLQRLQQAYHNDGKIEAVNLRNDKNKEIDHYALINQSLLIMAIKALKQSSK